MNGAELLPAPADSDPLVLADWAEAFILLSGTNELSSSEIRRQLRDTGILDEGHAEADDAAFAETVEEIGADGDSPESDDHDVIDALDDSPVIEMLLSEIQRRSNVASCVYPWSREPTRIVSSDIPDTASVVYSFLLWISLEDTPFRKKKKWTDAEWKFDHIASVALRSYLGPKSSAIAFGRPAATRQGPLVRPIPFPEAIRWLSEQLGLSGSWMPPRAARNDGGVDLIAWRRFEADERVGLIFILAQCTFRQSWHRKARDIVLNTWRGWVGFPTDPSTALIIPFVLPDGHDRVHEINTEADLILDRFRICELICDRGLDELEEIDLSETSQWLQTQFDEYDPAGLDAEHDDDVGAEFP